MMKLDRQRRSQDLKSVYSIGNEFQIAKVDNPSWCEGFNEPDTARQISDIAHRVEREHLLRREDAGVESRSHLISGFAQHSPCLARHCQNYFRQIPR